MRKLLPLALAALITAPAHAQLINGSFESNGAFSLEGWEWTCDDPTPVHNAPLNGGEWSARKNMGTANCSPSYLFQRLPAVQSGEHWELSGWVRADSVGWDAVPRMGFSSVSNGTFAFQSQIGSAAPQWEYVWITDTVHASATDTAVVLLTSGDGFMGSGWFDALELQPQSFNGLPTPGTRLHTYLDEDHVLHVAAGDRAIRAVRVFDAAGRVVPAALRAAAPGNVALDTAPWSTGLYVIRADTDSGPATVRFVKP